MMNATASTILELSMGTIILLGMLYMVIKDFRKDKKDENQTSK